jgi:hypothetical protein
LNSWTRIGFCLLLQASASAPAAQSRSDEFTIVVVPDVHAPNGPSQWVAIAKWITANCPAWNCKAIVAVGDYVNNPTVADEWLDFVAGYNIIMATGLPVVWPPGNHDNGYSQGYTTFDAHLGNAYPWTSCYPDCSHPHNQYVKVDVPVRAGMIRLGILGMDIFQSMSSGQPAEWAQHILDASEPDRQFMYASHMLVAGATGRVPGTGAWCYDVTTCTGGSSDPHTTGLGQWQDFIQWSPKIFWTFNGHIGYNPTSMTSVAKDGHAVHSFGQAGASGGVYTRIALLKFQPQAGNIRVSFVDPIAGQDAANLFAGDNWAWSPLPMPGLHRSPDTTRRPAPGRKNFD